MSPRLLYSWYNPSRIAPNTISEFVYIYLPKLSKKRSPLCPRICFHMPPEVSKVWESIIDVPQTSGCLYYPVFLPPQKKRTWLWPISMHLCSSPATICCYISTSRPLVALYVINAQYNPSRTAPNTISEFIYIYLPKAAKSDYPLSWPILHQLTNWFGELLDTYKTFIFHHQS